MAYDIWELGDGVPTVSAPTLKPAATLPATPQPKLSFWSLAVIILAIWLAVKEL